MQLHRVESVTAGANVARSPLETHDASGATAADGERVRFWRPLQPEAMNVICAEYVVGEVPFHAHEGVQVLLPLTPFVVDSGGGRSTPVYPGNVHVTGPYDVRAMRSLDGCAFSARLLILGLALVAPGSPTFGELVLDDVDYYADVMSIFDLLRRPLLPDRCESRLRNAVARLGIHGHRAAAHAARARPRHGVACAREHLRANPTQNITLDELAAAAGLSMFHLVRAFCRAYGLTPHAYQMQLRLARARRLLAEGRSVSYVTYEAGFADQSHLTRRFADFYGLTPAKYARQLATPPLAVRELARTNDHIVTPPAA